MHMNDYYATEFHNSEFGTVRVIDDHGVLLFCGADVAFALGYAKPRNAIRAHCRSALKRGILTNGGRQELTFITEGDVYRLIVKSRLEQAEKFEHWVFDEVLPAIRKNGGYVTDGLLERIKQDPEILMEFAENLVRERNRNQELTTTVQQLQVKADYYDHFMDKGECTNIRISAKEMGISEKKFVKFLINGSFLYRSPSGTLLPYAVSKNKGLFIVRDFINNGYFGSQTLITPKGKEFFKTLFEEENK